MLRGYHKDKVKHYYRNKKIPQWSSEDFLLVVLPT